MNLPSYFIIFDTEYTSWKGSQERNWNGKNEYKEIVQISGFKINKKKSHLEIIDKIDIIVKPKINPLLSEYFINLTGITQKKVEKEGIQIEKANEIFYNFCKNNNQEIPLYSYGNDFKILEENFNYIQIPNDSKFRKWKKYFFDI